MGVHRVNRMTPSLEAVRDSISKYKPTSLGRDAATKERAVTFGFTPATLPRLEGLLTKVGRYMYHNQRVGILCET